MIQRPCIRSNLAWWERSWSRANGCITKRSSQIRDTMLSVFPHGDRSRSWCILAARVGSGKRSKAMTSLIRRSGRVRCQSWKCCSRRWSPTWWVASFRILTSKFNRRMSRRLYQRSRKRIRKMSTRTLSLRKRILINHTQISFLSMVSRRRSTRRTMRSRSMR